MCYISIHRALLNRSIKIRRNAVSYWAVGSIPMDQILPYKWLLNSITSRGSVPESMST